MRRILKYFSFGLTGVILLIFLLAGVTQTRFFKNRLRDFAVAQINISLNGKLQIDQINGNLFNRLEIAGILLSSREDTIIYIPKVSLEYTPTRILKNEILINSVFFKSPRIKLEQRPDNSWNVSHLLKTSPAEPSDSGRASTPLNYLISLIDFQIVNASLEISALDSLIPQRIKNFNLRLSAGYADSLHKLELKKFQLQTERPAFDLRELSFTAAKTDSEISLQNLVIRTAKNQFDVQGKYFSTGNSGSKIGLKSKPFDFSEIHFFLPAIRISGKPKFNLRANFINDSLRVNLNIAEGNQRIFLETRLANISKALDSFSSKQVHYSLKGEIQQLDLFHWLADSAFDLLVNGNFQLTGSGMTPEDAALAFDANFSQCLIFQRPLSYFNLKGNYTAGNISSKLNIVGDFGEIALNANVTGVADSRKFDIRANLLQIDVGKLTLNDSLPTNINGQVLAQGNGLDMKNMRSHLALNLTNSAFLDFALDTLFAEIQLSGDKYSIDTLMLDNELIQLSLAGEASPLAIKNLTFQARLGDLMALNHILEADSVQATGHISGQLSGKWDSLSAQAKYQLNDIVFNTNSADSISGELSLFIAPEHFQGTNEVNLINAGTPDFRLDFVNVKSNFTRQLIDVLLNISTQDSFQAQVETRIMLDSIPRVIIPNITLNLKDQRWSGGSSKMQLLVDKNNWQIQNFRLTSPTDSSNNLQEIRVDGTFSLNGAENLQLEISGIEIGNPAALFQIREAVEGQLFYKMAIRGTAAKPVITGNTRINNIRFNQFYAESFSGDFNYHDQCLVGQFALIPAPNDSLIIKGRLPINLSFSEPKKLFEANQPIAVQVKSKGLSFGAMHRDDDRLNNFQGNIICDLKLSNTIKNPRVNGFFKIDDAAFKLEKYGIDYTDLKLAFSVDTTHCSIDTLQARRDDGFITASGNLDLDSTLISGLVKNINLNFQAHEFFLARHKDFEIQISGNAQLTGNQAAPQLDGSVKIVRSSFYIPALMTGENFAPAEDTQLIPLLVAATRKSPESILSPAKQSVETAKENDPSEFYNNLRSAIKLTIPRNTWIKSNEMIIEISGELDLVKDGADFEIFGSIQIVRGNYDLYGRRFEILEGELIFQGGEEYNPVVNLKARYIFRTAAREKKTLKLSVTDQALTPKLQFTLDDYEITEGDAASIILFGRSLNELTYGQKTGIAGESESEFATGDLAKILAAGLISNHLAKTIGNELNLDFIEINASSDWQKASFVVGKYLTNDLFMSYQQNFGENQDDDIAKKSITLEYELTRFMFLQLLEGYTKESGIDVIFKFER